MPPFGTTSTVCVPQKDSSAREVCINKSLLLSDDDDDDDGYDAASRLVSWLVVLLGVTMTKKKPSVAPDERSLFNWELWAASGIKSQPIGNCTHAVLIR